MNNKVNFLIAGTQKGGTTALDAYLRKHPDLCMANRKEVHYFDNEKVFRNNKPDYSRYHAFFSPKTPKDLLGETTPIYMYWYDAPKRIWQYNPAIKLIIILRNPIERAYSHWNMMRTRKHETLEFFDAIKTESRRCRTALPYQHKKFSYIDRGFYSGQLRRIWTYFDKKQVLMIRNEELNTNPLDTVNRVCTFLGVNQFKQIREITAHSNPYLNEMSQEEWDYLFNIYELEILSLERLLDWDCKDWLEKK